MLRNSTSRWGWPAKTLHWVGAILVLLLLGHGWWMTHLAPRGPDRLAHYAGHAALGYDFLVLLALRLLWRWMNPVPALPPETKVWEKLAAWCGHAGLYVLMFAATIAGWALAGTMRTPMQQDVFGIPFPALVSGGALHELFEDAHKVLAYVLAVLVVVHVAGALRHHLVNKNAVLRRMAA